MAISDPLYVFLGKERAVRQDVRNRYSTSYSGGSIGGCNRRFGTTAGSYGASVCLM